MIYTLFFNRYRPDLVDERKADYDAHAAAIHRRVLEAHPGFVDMKAYTAEDGERLVVVRFRDLESQDAWRDDAIHRQAQRAGRDAYYDEYRIVVCDEIRGRTWARRGGDEGEAETEVGNR